MRQDTHTHTAVYAGTHTFPRGLLISIIKSVIYPKPMFLHTPHLHVDRYQLQLNQISVLISAHNPSQPCDAGLPLFHTLMVYCTPTPTPHNHVMQGYHTLESQLLMCPIDMTTIDMTTCQPSSSHPVTWAGA